MRINLNNKGFTLIELIMIIVLLGILSATAVVLIGNVLEQQRTDETIKEMNELKMAMLGNPELIQSGARSSFGYVGDMGSLPSSLTAFVEKGALPAFQKTGGAGGYDAALPDLGTGAGWRGPYIDDKKDDAGNYLALRDGWGNPYVYDPAAGQITSYGPDGASGGWDDITIPETSVSGVIRGNVIGQVRGIQGGVVEGAVSRIYSPDGSGAHTTRDFTTDSTGFYNFSSIPIGRRTIRVTSGSLTISDTAVIEGGKTVIKDFVIVEPVAPNPPTGLTVSRASYTSLTLSWTASASPDLAGYKIYRGTTAGGETLYKTGVTGTSYVDDNNGIGLAAGTTYYYRMSAFDAAGNESTLTPSANETVSPVQQSGVAPYGADAPPGGCVAANRKSVELNIKNNDALSTITVDRIRVSWSGGGGGTLRRIQSPTGTNVYNNPTGVGSGTLIPVVSFNLASGATQSMKLFFCDPNPTGIILEFNPVTYDGYFTIATQ